MMSGISSKNTKPDKEIRSALHRRGFRFGLSQALLFGMTMTARYSSGRFLAYPFCAQKLGEIELTMTKFLKNLKPQDGVCW